MQNENTETLLDNIDQYSPGEVKEIHCATWAYNRQTLLLSEIK